MAKPAYKEIQLDLFASEPVFESARSPDADCMASSLAIGCHTPPQSPDFMCGDRFLATNTPWAPAD